MPPGAGRPGTDCQRTSVRGRRRQRAVPPFVAVPRPCRGRAEFFPFPATWPAKSSRMRRGYAHPTSGSVVAESHTAVAPRLPAGQPWAGPAAAGPGAASPAQVALDQAAPAASGPQALRPRRPRLRLPASSGPNTTASIPHFCRALSPDSRPNFRPVPARIISAFSTPSASDFRARHRPGFRPVRSPLLAPIVPDFLTGFLPHFRPGLAPIIAAFLSPSSSDYRRPSSPTRSPSPRPTRQPQSQLLRPQTHRFPHLSGPSGPPAASPPRRLGPGHPGKTVQGSAPICTLLPLRFPYVSYDKTPPVLPPRFSAPTCNNFSATPDTN